MKPFSAPYTLLTDRLRGRGVMGGFLDSVPFQNTFPSISTTTGSSVLQGFTVAVYEIGCAFGALSVIFGGDRVGRRTTVIYGQAILIIGAVLQFSSYSLAQLIVGRIVSSRPTSRGRAVMWQLNINICTLPQFGIALAYWVDYGLSESSLTGNTNWSWRFPLSLQVIFAGVTISLSSFLPGKITFQTSFNIQANRILDSPRALVKQGRMDDARDVINMLSLEADPTERENYTVLNTRNISRILKNSDSSLEYYYVRH
ncbi:hypothetical protein N7528_007014 [Penicillium herquei]|nr:hypothetical protein N7528_007014 [Penicillium herquei]